MLLSLSAAALIVIQDPPPPAPPPPPPEHRVRVHAFGGPGLDKDGDGFVSREEFAAPMSEHFAEIDKDGDGRLSSDELGVLGGARHDVTVRTGDGENRQVFIVGGPGGGETRSWTSEDGREFRVETVTFRRDGPDAPPPPPPHPPQAPGAPGAPHVMVLGGPGGPMNGMADLDADGDGRVSEDEFLAPMREAFRKSDVDGSGALEQGERGRSDVRIFTRREETPAGE